MLPTRPRTRRVPAPSPGYPLTPPPSAKRPLSPSLLQVLDGAADPAHHLPINSRSLTVDTDMFYGRIDIHLKGLKSSSKETFAGKKRFFQIACQVGGRVCSGGAAAARACAAPV